MFYTVYMISCYIGFRFFFIDPACQNINTELHCYIADPLCPAIPRKKASPNYITIILTSVGSLILVAIIGIIVCYLWRRKSESLNQVQLLDISKPFLIILKK